MQNGMLITTEQGVHMKRIIMSIWLLSVATLLAGKENAVSLTICGVVMDDPYPMKRMSIPIANARIELRTQVATLQGTTDASPLLGALIDSATTGADGKFCFKNKAPQYSNVLIIHPDYRTRQIYISATADTTLNISLVGKDAVSSVSGSVSAACLITNETCSPKPVPECSVSVNIVSYVLTGFVPVKALTISTVTDAQGNYSIKNIPLSYNGEQVNVTAKKSGTIKTTVATIRNSETTTVNFKDFSTYSVEDTSSFQVSPAKPTSNDSILFRFFNANDCCCAIYRNMSVSVLDSTINIFYSLDNAPCLACNCAGMGKWAGINYKPLSPGKYNVYKSHSTYCPPGTMCPASMTAPVFLGTLIVAKPTEVVITGKKIKNRDAFTFSLAGSSVTVNLVKNSRVSLKAYSVNGALFGELYNGSLSTGSHNISINNLDRIAPADRMVILSLTADGETKVLKRVTASAR
jgi:hypothetical protein